MIRTIAYLLLALLSAGPAFGESADGRFRPVRASAVEGEIREISEILQSVGYLAGSVQAPSRAGVTLWDPGACDNGYSLYTSGHDPEAALIDMGGNTMHTWRCGFSDAFPRVRVRSGQSDDRFFRYAALRPETGELLAVFEGVGIVCLSAESEILWASECGAHHDLDILGDGSMLTLTRKIRRVNWPGLGDRVIRDDFVAVLSSDGAVIFERSIFEALALSPTAWADSLFSLPVSPNGDVFHTNSVSTMDDRDVLVSCRNLSAVFTVDLETGVADQFCNPPRWTLRGQHDAQFLPAGRILCFDNGWTWQDGKRRASVVCEWWADRRGGEPWSFTTPDLYSESCGSVQRLKNGNTLIAESDNGRALEVTPDGRTVWEFYNPHRAGTKAELIATLFMVRRIPFESVKFLE